MLNPLSPTARRLLFSGALLVVVYLAGRAALPLLAPGAVEPWRLGPGLALFAIGAALCGVRAAAFARDRAAWVLVGLAIAAYGSGTALNSAFGSATQSPVIAHALWLAFYVLLYAAVILMARAALRPFPWAYLLDALIAVLVLSATFLLLASYGEATSYRSWEAPLAIAYPALDLYLLAFVTWVASAGTTRQTMAWRPLRWALVLLLLGDLLLLGFGALGALGFGAPYTAIYPVAMVALGAAAWQQPPTPTKLRARTLAALRVPMAFGVIALTIAAAGVAGLVAPSAASVAIVAVIAVFARTVIVYQDLVAIQLSRRFERGFEDAGIGMAMIDESATWGRVNAALAALFEVDADALLGRPILERVAIVDRPRAAALIQRVQSEGGRVEPTPLRVHTLRGDAKDIMMAGDVLVDDHRRELFLQLRDVTGERRAARFSEVISDLSRAALDTADIDALTDRLTGELQHVLAAPFVALVLDGDRANAARVLAPAGSLAPGLRDALAYATGPVEAALRCELPYHWRRSEATGGPTEAGLAAANLQVVSIFPVTPATGLPGALCVGFERADAELAADALQFAMALANLLASAIDRSRREALSHHEALHDSLTGLANRTLLDAHVERAIEAARREGRLVGGVLIDLDRFKNVNDTLGHQAGDALLVDVAERVVGQTRGGDLVARLGGDEFVVIFDRPQDVGVLERFAERLIDVLRQPFTVGGRELYIGASVGIAMAGGAQGSAETLLRDADVAMYRAKAAGGGVHAVFDEHLRAELVARVDTERDLRHAVARGELRIALQPQIHLANGGGVSFEALVRWARPGHGVVAPGGFVQVAEDTGLIVPLGTWVLEESLAWASAMGQVTGSIPTVSVNLSGRQLNEGLPDIVAGALAEHGVEPASLVLELTETMLIADHEGTAVLAELRALGVVLSLDDFGTGFSSLAALQRHPVDELKLDRSMITALGVDPASAAVTRAAVDMALALGLTVVAEGVERVDQLAAVRKLGCQVAQGFLFSRPLSPADAQDYLVLRRWERQLAAATSE